jgi:choline monooxygenase
VNLVTTDVRDVGAWAGTRTDLRSATGLPPRFYTDPEVHQVELERVFERSWVCVALTSELREPGTVAVRSLGGRSIILTVDDDRVLHGFLNACRHRGTELVEADCTARQTMRCPYHRWGYALDGRLVSTPRFDGDGKRAFDRDQLGLVPIRVATVGCLVFACLDERTPAAEEWFGDLPQRLAGYGLESWAVQETLSVGIAANWKLITENYQEYYHLPWVHPELATVSRVDDHYRYQGPGMYCGQSTTPVTDEDGSTWLGLPPKAGLDPSDAVSGRHLAIFPNVMISILPNHVFVMRLEPDGPARTMERCTMLLPADTGATAGDAETAFAATRAFWLDVNNEDIDIVERSQRGLERGAVPPGPLVPRFEEPLHRFHRMLSELCTRDSSADITIPPGDGPDTDVALGGRPNPTPAAIDLVSTGRSEERNPA